MGRCAIGPASVFTISVKQSAPAPIRNVGRRDGPPRTTVSFVAQPRILSCKRWWNQHAIFMTTGSQFTTLRWVAPADGRYSVRGRVWVADTVGRPCRVKLAHNTVDVLVERRNFAGFGSAIPIDFPGLPLTQGSAIDLIFGPESGIDYMSLDVQLTIRPVDPGL